MVTWHPAATTRGDSKAKVTRGFLLHCRKAAQIALGKKPDPLPKFHYNPAPRTQQRIFKRWEDGFAFDIETPSLDDHRILAFAACGSPDEVMVWSLEDSRILKKLNPLRKALKDPKTRVVFQNADFDVPILRQASYEIPDECIWDTMIENQILFPDEPVNLSYLTSLVKDQEAWKHMRALGGEELLFYNGLDAWNTWDVYLGALEAYEDFE